MNEKKPVYVTVDGNEAAAYIAYAFSEIAAIYPITPSSPMAGKTDVWSAKGKKNLFGQTVQLVEMQSEAGAIAAVHGALETGALGTSFTSSQGLMLMIPVMHRIAGQRHPGVLHVAARTVGTHALSIFGDHSDVMNCRQTGFAMLCTGSVQEVMDLAAVAHLSAIRGRVPFMHFFDGFRTSHEINKVRQMDYEDLRGMLDYDALDAFRAHALNPEHPLIRSTVQNPDIYFQVREANNTAYSVLPDIVEDYMAKINAVTGCDYHVFNYYGAPDADRVLVAMGSVSGCIEETVDALNARGEKVGFVQVHLFRPFDIKRFIAALPETVRAVGVLDRTKEMGSAGEPLYQDVCTALKDRRNVVVVGGRYGLSSKDTTPEQIAAAFENLKKEITAEGGRIAAYYDNRNQIAGYATLLTDGRQIKIEECVYLNSTALIKLVNVALLDKESVHLHVSAGENVRFIFPDAEVKNYGHTMVRLNDPQLFSRLFNTRIETVEDAFAISKKPLNMNEYV